MVAHPLLGDGIVIVDNGPLVFVDVDLWNGRIWGQAQQFCEGFDVGVIMLEITQKVDTNWILRPRQMQALRRKSGDFIVFPLQYLSDELGEIQIVFYLLQAF